MCVYMYTLARAHTYIRTHVCSKCILFIRKTFFFSLSSLYTFILLYKYRVPAICVETVTIYYS